MTSWKNVTNTFSKKEYKENKEPTAEFVETFVEQLICNSFLHLLRMILCENNPRYFVQILHVNIDDV